jgi:hypothetical protein
MGGMDLLNSTMGASKCKHVTDHLNRRLARESPETVLQPINRMSRSISARIKVKARSTPACPAAASGKR